jgi:plasmid segregation protein ParM
VHRALIEVHGADEQPLAIENEQLRGAFLFKKAVKAAFATHQILGVKEPMFANVRGYQIAGTGYAQTMLQGQARAVRAVQAEGEGA